MYSYFFADGLLPKTFVQSIEDNDADEVNNCLGGKQPIPVEIRNEASQTGLMLACQFQASDVVKTYLSFDPDLEATDYLGWSAVHHAARGGCLDILDALSEANANFFAKTNLNETILHIAAKTKSDDVIKWFLVRYVENSQYKMNILHTKDVDGWLALHHVSNNGCLESVQALINLDSDVTSRTHNQETCLYLAASSGHSSIVRLLFGKGGLTNNPHQSCKIPLHGAIMNKQQETIQVLLNLGVQVDTFEVNDGFNALQIAAKWGFEEIARDLISFGADINASTNSRGGMGKWAINH